MLNANTTRDINQAARSVEKYLKEQGIVLPHAKSLELIARTLGKTTHMAAQAGLPDVGLDRSMTLKSYADLKQALSLLTPEQLAMRITVSEGCDENGNAEFFASYEFMRADSDALQAGSDGVLAGCQPVLLFTAPDAAEEELAQASPQLKPASAALDDVCRVLLNPDVDAQLHVQGISDAAYDALAQAVGYLSENVFNLRTNKPLTRAYDALPVTASPLDHLRGKGNWGLTESEFEMAQKLAQALCPGHAEASAANSTLHESLERLEAQFELSTGISPTTPTPWLRENVLRDGMARAISDANELFGTTLSMGAWLMKSDSEQGFWCNGFGWTSSRVAATGYPAGSATLGMPKDATWVKFSDAVDFD
jgi:hypothetical protein